ncbi:hypothetical protein M5X00_28105 [Paenibacillus alvei]|uniref:HTH LytTR-type domain-containing protein n=1 Tax=Paenibacillus alvei TaxID=44250 RepID=A0ABT4H2J0_PAEAL|nr:hypothetical protein [Paenibacillus alvei]EJW15619.1 hypothetical protein PAV_8c02880 [Paenibacillus alvei DSM 29]MCY9542609.1 hypothetical protein [Paenibacillus alvei]MCY9706500.1 hypothetical protein [Paenibacillus alvei]MCY9736471.1 hypothetical protein [Paenibacillus alvei]MCY9758094.1 hypothetical protein [Paenibacillus alvei]
MITRLSVALDPYGYQGLAKVRIDKIFYLVYDGIIKRVVIRADDRDFYLPGSLSFWVNVINHSGYSFEFISRGKAVNIKNATCIDIKECRIHVRLGDISQWIGMSRPLCQEITKKYKIIPQSDRKN